VSRWKGRRTPLLTGFTWLESSFDDAGATEGGAFVFDSRSPLFKVSDADILEGLRRFARAHQGRRLSMKRFDAWPGRPCSDDTIMKRFGTWRNALRRIGVEGGRARRYSPEFMVEVLERVWRKVGRRPGASLLWRHARVTHKPFNKHWGSLRAACEALDAFHGGRITREELLRGCPRARLARPQLPRSRRFAVLRRDGFRCRLCGRGAESNPPVELEVDHIVPVSKGGGHEESNLRALCRECNRGKGVGDDVDVPKKQKRRV